MTEKREQRVSALICAAGVGRRMGLGHPKQYLPMAGAPLLVHTVRALRRAPSVGGIVVVVSPDDHWIDETARLFPEGVRVLRAGGAERADTVRQGLGASGFEKDAWVLVHDAARPCVAPEEVERLVDEVLGDPECDGGILVLPMTDTVKRVDDKGLILETVPRADLRRALTPQLFRAGALLRALTDVRTGVTDEAFAMEHAGARIRVVEGLPTNIKVTHPGDDRTARFLLGDAAMTPLRVGQGFDSHRFASGRPLILGGVRIPFEKGLAGHSDADVLLHAITDAVLGAAALGDIGTHFPPTDDRWKGAKSSDLLTAVMMLVHEKGWKVVNLDATIITERPKIGPHRAVIEASVAKLLDVGVREVSVKAKTNEGMDAVGRLEGMAAQAVVLLARV